MNIQCIKGKVYVDESSCSRIYQYNGKDESVGLYINQNDERIYRNHGGLRRGNTAAREATDFEIEWLRQCTEAGKFIPKENIKFEPIMDNYEMY
jgi:hypothetical protein